MVTIVLLLLSMLLVLAGVVTLVIGIVSNTLGWVIASIALTVGAGVVLYGIIRLGRRAEVMAAAAAGAEGVSTEAIGLPASAGRPARGATVAAAGFPIADYDDLRVAEIVPLLPELDPEELKVVRERELSGKNRASVIARIDELVSSAVAEPSFAAGGAEAAFPIADYDELRVPEILPLLPELDYDELALVAARERVGAAREPILARIEELSLVATAPAPARRQPAKKAAAKAVAKKAAAKAAVKKAPARKVATKKAPARKIATKTAPARKAAVKKPPPRKAGATRR